MPWESGLAFPSPSSVAAPVEWEAGRQAGAGSEYPSFPREAISLVCEAVPGAKGATRRRKVLGVLGDRDAAGKCGGTVRRQVWGMWGEGQETSMVCLCWEPSPSKTLGPTLAL